jgi:hypothetical protein
MPSHRARFTALLASSFMLLAPGVAAAQDAAGAAVALGVYDCSFFSMSTGLQPTPGLNVSITGPGLYTDASGHSGTFTYDPSTRILTMTGGDVGGEHLIYGSGPNLNYLDDDGETFLAQCDLLHP